MCNPLALAAIAVVGTATSVVSQVQAANANNKAIRQSLAVQREEIDQSTTAEINDRLRAARRERGRILVAAGESGLSLSSGGVEALLFDTYQQAELANDRSLANRESRQDAATANAQSQIQSKPTVLGAGLQIAASGVRAYGGAESSKNKKES